MGCDYVSESSGSTNPLINVDFAGRSFNRFTTGKSEGRDLTLNQLTGRLEQDLPH
jgi:hypothetical protein